MCCPTRSKIVDEALDRPAGNGSARVQSADELLLAAIVPDELGTWTKS